MAGSPNVSAGSPKVDSTTTQPVESKSTVSKATSWVKASYINPQNWTLSGAAKVGVVALATLTAFLGAVWKGYASLALPYVGTISQAAAFNAFAVGTGVLLLSAVLVGAKYALATGESKADDKGAKPANA